MASENEASCESDPNFAVICCFLEKFGGTCGLSNIDFPDLQEMLENTQEVSQDLIELHIKLLRKAKKSVSNERWERALIKMCHSFCSQDAWELERFGYKKSRISAKLRILKQLLEMQFDLNQKFKNEVNKMSAEELRTQPLGRDRLGNAYWCQCDDSCQIRVYKEDPDEETWCLVAKDRGGLVSLISQLGSGDSAKSSSEPVSNEDSNSLEIEKPILDTGQIADSSSSSAMSTRRTSEDDSGEAPAKTDEVQNFVCDQMSVAEGTTNLGDPEPFVEKDSTDEENSREKTKSSGHEDESNETERPDTTQKSHLKETSSEKQIVDELEDDAVDIFDEESEISEDSRSSETVNNNMPAVIEDALNLSPVNKSVDFTTHYEKNDEQFEYDVESKTGLDLTVKPKPTLRLKPLKELLGQSQSGVPELEKKEFIGIKGKYIRGDPSGEKISLSLSSYSSSTLHRKAVQSASFDAISYKRSVEDDDYEEPAQLKRPRLDRPTLLGNKKFLPSYLNDDGGEVEVEDEIEEPLMLVHGESSGYDNECVNINTRKDDSPIIGQEIEEPTLYVFGEGSGLDCQTGKENINEADVPQSTNSDKSEIKLDLNNEANFINRDLPGSSESVLDSERSLNSPNKLQYKLGTVVDSKTDKTATKSQAKKSRWDVSPDANPNLETTDDESTTTIPTGKVKELVDKFESVNESQTNFGTKSSIDNNSETSDDSSIPPESQDQSEIEGAPTSDTSLIKKSLFFFGNNCNASAGTNVQSASLNFGASSISDSHDVQITSNISTMESSLILENSETENSKKENTDTITNTNKVPDDLNEENKSEENSSEENVPQILLPHGENIDSSSGNSNDIGERATSNNSMDEVELSKFESEISECDLSVSSVNINDKDNEICNTDGNTTDCLTKKANVTADVTGLSDKNSSDILTNLEVPKADESINIEGDSSQLSKRDIVENIESEEEHRETPNSIEENLFEANASAFEKTNAQEDLQAEEENDIDPEHDLNSEHLTTANESQSPISPVSDSEISDNRTPEATLNEENNTVSTAEASVLLGTVVELVSIEANSIRAEMNSDDSLKTDRNTVETDPDTVLSDNLLQNQSATANEVVDESEGKLEAVDDVKNLDNIPVSSAVCDSDLKTVLVDSNSSLHEVEDSSNTSTDKEELNSSECVIDESILPLDYSNVNQEQTEASHISSDMSAKILKVESKSEENNKDSEAVNSSKIDAVESIASERNELADDSTESTERCLNFIETSTQDDLPNSIEADKVEEVDKTRENVVLDGQEKTVDEENITSAQSEEELNSKSTEAHLEIHKKDLHTKHEESDSESVVKEENSSDDTLQKIDACDVTLPASQTQDDIHHDLFQNVTVAKQVDEENKSLADTDEQKETVTHLEAVATDGSSSSTDQCSDESRRQNVLDVTKTETTNEKSLNAEDKGDDEEIAELVETQNTPEANVSEEMEMKTDDEIVENEIVDSVNTSRTIAADGNQKTESKILRKEIADSANLSKTITEREDEKTDDKILEIETVDSAQMSKTITKGEDEETNNKILENDVKSSKTTTEGGAEKTDENVLDNEVVNSANISKTITKEGDEETDDIADSSKTITEKGDEKTSDDVLDNEIVDSVTISKRIVEQKVEKTKDEILENDIVDSAKDKTIAEGVEIFNKNLQNEFVESADVDKPIAEGRDEKTEDKIQENEIVDLANVDQTITEEDGKVGDEILGNEIVDSTNVDEAITEAGDEKAGDEILENELVDSINVDKTITGGGNEKVGDEILENEIVDSANINKSKSKGGDETTADKIVENEIVDSANLNEANSEGKEEKIDARILENEIVDSAKISKTISEAEVDKIAEKIAENEIEDSASSASKTILEGKDVKTDVKKLENDIADSANASKTIAEGGDDKTDNKKLEIVDSADVSKPISEGDEKNDDKILESEISDSANINKTILEGEAEKTGEEILENEIEDSSPEDNVTASSSISDSEKTVTAIEQKKIEQTVELETDSSDNSVKDSLEHFSDCRSESEADGANTNSKNVIDHTDILTTSPIHDKLPNEVTDVVNIETKTENTSENAALTDDVDKTSENNFREKDTVVHEKELEKLEECKLIESDSCQSESASTQKDSDCAEKGTIESVSKNQCDRVAHEGKEDGVVLEVNSETKSKVKEPEIVMPFNASKLKLPDVDKDEKTGRITRRNSQGKRKQESTTNDNDMTDTKLNKAGISDNLIKKSVDKKSPLEVEVNEVVEPMENVCNSDENQNKSSDVPVSSQVNSKKRGRKSKSLMIELRSLNFEKRELRSKLKADQQSGNEKEKFEPEAAVTDGSSLCETQDATKHVETKPVIEGGPIKKKKAAAPAKKILNLRPKRMSLDAVPKVKPENVTVPPQKNTNKKPETKGQSPKEKAIKQRKPSIEKSAAENSPAKEVNKHKTPTPPKAGKQSPKAQLPASLGLRQKKKELGSKKPEESLVKKRSRKQQADSSKLRKRTESTDSAKKAAASKKSDMAAKKLEALQKSECCNKTAYVKMSHDLSRKISDTAKLNVTVALERCDVPPLDSHSHHNEERMMSLRKRKPRPLGDVKPKKSKDALKKNMEVFEETVKSGSTSTTGQTNTENVKIKKEVVEEEVPKQETTKKGRRVSTGKKEEKSPRGKRSNSLDAHLAAENEKQQQNVVTDAVNRATKMKQNPVAKVEMQTKAAPILRRSSRRKTGSDVGIELNVESRLDTIKLEILSPQECSNAVISDESECVSSHTIPKGTGTIKDVEKAEALDEGLLSKRFKSTNNQKGEHVEGDSLAVNTLEQQYDEIVEPGEVETIDLTSENEVDSTSFKMETRNTRYQEKLTDCKQGVMIKGVLIKGDVTIKVKERIPVEEPLCVKKNVPLLTCINIEKLKDPESKTFPSFNLRDEKYGAGSPISEESYGGDVDGDIDLDEDVDADADADADADNNSDVVIIEDDPLADIIAPVEVVPIPLTLSSFKLDSTDPLVAPTARSLRKRTRTELPGQIIEESGGKKRKMKGKRSVDLELRKSIEEQKRLEISSSDEDNTRQVKNKDSFLKSKKRKSASSSPTCVTLDSPDAITLDSPTPPIVVDSPTVSSDVTTRRESPVIVKKRSPPKKRKKTLLGLDIPTEAELQNSAECSVRQSRRIAQIKIKEEAERRKLEEIALNETKPEKKHKSKKSEDKDYKVEKRKKAKDLIIEEEIAVDVPEEEDKKKKRKRKHKHKDPRKIFDESNPWRSSSDSSTSNEEDDEEEIAEYSEAESPLFKSDHEFSPESDLEESGEVQPLKRARTARKEDDIEEDFDDHACQKCGKQDHPEWILLCDGCDNGWHCSCLRPALLIIPEGDWYCPPCQHISLIKSLEGTLVEYDKKLTKRGIEERRKERLAYVGISLANVLPVKERNEQRPKKSREEEVESESEETESDSEFSSDSESDEPIYQLRQRRQAHSYRFNDYDDLINSAIQDEVEAKGAGNQGRGKDIATIVNAEKEEEARQKEMQELEPLPPVVPVEGKDLPQVVLPQQENDSDAEEIKPVKKLIGRKKHRKLNCLDVSSGDDPDSDEDFKGSSSAEEEDEYDEEMGSDSSEGYSKKRGFGPVRRSTRARTSRYDKEFIDDDSEDDVPRKKKIRSGWDDSESEESDSSWKARRKRKTGSKRQLTLPKKKSSKKNRKILSDSDSEMYKKKKPKIKYGGLDEDEDLGRRTRGKRINYLDALASDSDEEVKKRAPPRIESDEEYDANEEQDPNDDDDIEEEKESDENEIVENVVGPPVSGVLTVPDLQIATDQIQQQLVEPVLPLNVQQLPEEEKNLYDDQDMEDEECELNPIEEINKNLEQMNEKEMEMMMEEEEYANKQLQLMALQLEKEKKRREREAKKLEQVGVQQEVPKVPKKRGRKPKTPELKNALPIASLQVGPDMQSNTELSEPPGITIPIYTGLPLSNVTPEGTPKKRRGRGKGKKTLEKEQAAAAAAAAAAVTGSGGTYSMDSSNSDHIPSTVDSVPSSSNSPSSNASMHAAKLTIATPPQPFSQSQPTPSVITRMLQSSQPGQGNFHMAGGMGHKYYSGEAPPPHSDSSSTAGPPVQGQYMHAGPRVLAPPYRQPIQNMNPYPIARGTPVPAHRLRAPAPQGITPMYHSHHPLDPSPSGGGPISVPVGPMNMTTASISAPPGTLSAGDRNSPVVAPPTSDSPLSNKSDQTPPPPPYNRPPQMTRFPPGNSSPLMPPSPARHLMPPQHVQQPRTSMPYHPGMPPNYYGSYMHPNMTAEESLPPSYQYSEQFSDGSSPQDNCKPYEEENSGEFGGLVSYFSSQREDDLDT